ncbi:MAG: hypothetical protein ABJZ55_22115 [Fuerstiella sp.]
MSTIRFIHTDYLRLARSLQGIASAPGWLQEALTDATRRATRQTIETAMSENADFLLIAGSPTDKFEDLDIACAWLDEQFVVARRSGIKIVAVTDNESEVAALRKVCDVVVDRHHTLIASRTMTGEVRLSTSINSPTNRNELAVSFGDLRADHSDLTCHYHVLSGVAPELRSDLHHQARTGFSATAGAIQSAGPDEQWNGRCVVVTADLDTFQIHTASADVSSIRYVTERLSIEGRTTHGRLVEEIAMASRNLQRSQTETVLVDWVITTPLECRSGYDARSLEQDQLLTALRTDLHSGHQGVWPRSVRFSDQSSVHVANENSESVRLLEAIAVDAHYGRSDLQAVTPELLCSLAALQEAA